MQKASLLARVPLFAGLNDLDRAALAERLREHVVPADEVVFSKGDRGTSMFVILSGTVRVFLPAPSPNGPCVILKELRVGEYFGELSLFDDQPRSASVTATSDACLGELTRDDLLRYLQGSSGALVALLSEMSVRLRQTNELLSERAAKDINKEVEERLTMGQRLADQLARLNGSWTFIILLLVFSLLWVLVNRVFPVAFDAYPYPFYNLVLAILAALQGPLIVMSQNRQALKDRLNADTDFRVNLKNEIGIEQLLREVAALRAEMNARPRSLDRAG